MEKYVKNINYNTFINLLKCYRTVALKDKPLQERSQKHYMNIIR